MSVQRGQAGEATSAPPAERLHHIYRTMVRLRTFDNRLTDLGKMREPIIHHPGLGQEAPCVTSCATLRPDDVMMPYHRGWAWAIGKGMDPARILAELLGRKSGYGSGKSGPNLADWDLHVLGRPGVQGAHLQIAAGVGLGLRLEDQGRVCMTFFGEGASNTGAFHEGLNLAAVLNSNTVYVCESNNYQSATPVREVMRIKSVAERAVAYGVPGYTIDGNDVFQIYQTVSEAVDRARKGEGPTLIDCRTYLMGDNYYQPDVIGPPRGTPEEAEAWRDKDPIVRLKTHMLDAGLMTESDVERIDSEAHDEIEAAVRFAYDSPYPTKDDLREGVYA